MTRTTHNENRANQDLVQVLPKARRSPSQSSGALTNVTNNASGSPAPALKECGHSYCNLYLNHCCACLDLRPQSSHYPVYVDGWGDTLLGKRHSLYCTGCKDHFEPKAVAKSSGVKYCQHDHCNLALNLCCACSDSRPEQDSYPVYIDRVGETSNGKRYDHYCTGCKSHFDPPKIIAPPPEPVETCEHGWCVLRGEKCCACYDGRPHLDKYIIYIDGKGDVEGHRWSRYCSGCVEYYDPASAPPRVVKTCEHHECEVNTSQCCACSDTRRVEKIYPGYTPDVGDTWDGQRWTDYCGHCQKRINAFTQQYPPEVVASCEHQGCEANATHCCACSDDRPMATAYPRFTERVGITWDGDRWTAYCARCQERCSAEAAIELKQSVIRGLKDVQKQDAANRPRAVEPVASCVIA